MRFRSTGCPLPLDGGVYLLVHEPSGRWYVGSSLKVRQRLSVHVTLAMTRSASAPLAHLIKRDGPGAFTAWLLESVAGRRDLAPREAAWLEHFRRIHPAGALNVRPVNHGRRFPWRPSGADILTVS